MRPLVCVAWLLGALSAAASDEPRSAHWPGFRGPAGSGAADGDSLPERWSRTENVVWSIAVPGRGWSSPIVWGDRVFLTSAIAEGSFKEPLPGLFGNDEIAALIAAGKSEQEAVAIVLDRDLEITGEGSPAVRFMVYAVDANSGELLWQREAAHQPPPGGRHRKNTYASETPATDGERVYAYFGNVGLFAYALDGALLWSRRLEPKKIYLDFGTASSPALDERQVYVLNDNDEESYLIAFDKASGEERWRVVRSGAGQNSAWSSPFVWQHESRREIVAVGMGRVISYDPAGGELWRLNGTALVAAPTPTAAFDLLFISGGSTDEDVRPLVAVRPGARGDITPAVGTTSSSHVAWLDRRGGSYIPSPLPYRDRLFVLYDRGFLAAYDLKTGEQRNKVRIGRGGNTFSASPWAYGGKLFALSEAGDTFVFTADDRLELLHVNALDEMTLASPAIASRSLYLRTSTRLYRIAGGDR